MLFPSSESRAICRYISETYADRGNRYLLGRDLLDRVSIEQWLKSEEQSFDPPSRALVLHLAFPPSSKSYNELLEESERLSKVLDVYNHRLGDSRYLAGDEFTLADLTHLPNSQYIATSDEWGHLFDERENVKRWWEEVSTRPSWSKVLEEIKIREEVDEEEMTEEVEKDFIRITRQSPKTSLKASIFEPIEASAQLPVKPKSTFTINKNVARPKSSVQVTVPDKRGFSVSVPAIERAPVETARIQSHSTLHSDETTTKPGDVSPKTKQPISDAKVKMDSSAIPPTSTQVPSTAHIDKASTKPTGITSQSTMPVTDAKVTMEESAIPPTSTHIDKSSTKPPGVVSRSTMPATDAKVTTGESAIPPTGTHIDKSSTKPPGVVSRSTMPATDAKETMEESAIPPTGTQARVDKASTKPTGVEKTSFPPPRTEAPSTSQTVPQTKPSLEGMQAPPTEKTSTRPPSKGQGQTTTTDSKRGQAGEEPTSKKEVTEIDEKAYLAAKHKDWEEQWRKPEKFGEEKYTESIPVKKPKPPQLEDTPSTKPTPATISSSEAARQEPVTDKSTNVPAKEPFESRTTAKPKDTTPPAATQGSALSKTSEVSPGPTATSQASLSNSIDKTQGGITDETNNALGPKPPKIQGTAPLTTPTPAAETTPQTARPEPMTNKLTTPPAKDQSKSAVRDTQEEPYPGETTTKPQDTAPAVATLKTTIPDATQQLPQPSTDEATGGIANKTNNLPTKSPTATFPTATSKPMTDTPNTVPAPETAKPSDPVVKEDSSRGKATKEPKETTPLAPESATIPAATQKNSRETTGKSQAPPTTAQTQPTDEVASGITDVSQPGKAPAESQSENIPKKLGDDTTKSEQARSDLKGASTDAKLDNGLAKNSQAIAQKVPLANEAPSKPPATPSTEKAGSVDEIRTEGTKDKAPSNQTAPTETSTEGVPSLRQTSSDKEQATTEQISNGTTHEAKVPSPNDKQGSKLPQDENSSPPKETAPNSTLKQNENQSGNKTETDQLGSSKSNQEDNMQPDNSNDATTRNETLSETNQTKASQQDKEGISSKEPSTKPRTEQNSEPDSTNKTGPVNQE